MPPSVVNLSSSWCLATKASSASHVHKRYRPMPTKLVIDAHSGSSTCTVMIPHTTASADFASLLCMQQSVTQSVRQVDHVEKRRSDAFHVEHNTEGPRCEDRN